jgi:hypothetical protein
MCNRISEIANILGIFGTLFAKAKRILAGRILRRAFYFTLSGLWVMFLFEFPGRFPASRDDIFFPFREMNVKIPSLTNYFVC